MQPKRIALIVLVILLILFVALVAGSHAGIDSMSEQELSAKRTEILARVATFRTKPLTEKEKDEIFDLLQGENFIKFGFSGEDREIIVDALNHQVSL